MIAALICLVCVVVLVNERSKTRAAVQLAADGLEERSLLEQKFGPWHDSQFAEEWIIRDFFNDRRGGVFLDVGANEYRRASTTYYLETQLGWSGVAIDAQREFAADYRRYRPRTQFFSLFVSDVSDAEVKLFIPTERRLNASSNRQAIDFGDPIEVRDVSTITLNDLLARVKIGHVDFVSMDIELAEPKALAGFDVERFAPALLCVEGHVAVRQAILDYFQQHRYVVVGRYLRADTENLYFMPANSH